MKLVNSNIPTITLGNVTVPLKSNYFLLLASAGANLYDSFMKPDGTKYQVPTGKSLRILAIRAQAVGSTNDNWLGKATAAVTNGAAPAGYASVTSNQLPSTLNSSPVPMVEMPMDVLIGAGLYPTYRSVTAPGLATILCEEV
jgi:hypothetical protein